MTLDKVWLSLQRCLEEAMKCKGGNEYYMQHADKGEASSQSYEWLQSIECKFNVYDYASRSLHGSSSGRGSH